MRPVTTALRYDGEVLGFATTVGVRFTAATERLAKHDPAHARWVKRFVFAMGLYAVEVIRGHLPAPYQDARAEYFARTFLIDDHAFRHRADRTDAQLAGRFGVPPKQIALKRLDLTGETDPQSAPPTTPHDIRARPPSLA